MSPAMLVGSSIPSLLELPRMLREMRLGAERPAVPPTPEPSAQATIETVD
jgi:hypothetical protein